MAPTGHISSRDQPRGDQSEHLPPSRHHQTPPQPHHSQGHQQHRQQGILHPAGEVVTYQVIKTTYCLILFSFQAQVLPSFSSPARATRQGVSGCPVSFVPVTRVEPEPATPVRVQLEGGGPGGEDKRPAPPSQEQPERGRGRGAGRGGADRSRSMPGFTDTGSVWPRNYQSCQTFQRTQR